MKLRILLLAALGASGALAMACSSTVIKTTAGADGDAGADGGADPNAVDEDDPANQPPHALGTIMLGESHVSGGSSKSTPIVSAAFLPDAQGVPYCRTKLDASCVVQKAAKCTKDTTTGTGCASGEYCALDTSCASVCKKVAVCEDTCADDEVCVAGSSANAKGTCQKQPTFDAGPIAFSGTTTAITLYPPYRYEGDGVGAPFLAGADIHVQASGAVSAGFEAFDETFKATTFLQTKTALNKIPRATVFGTGDIPVSWVAGSDAIQITLSGPGGTVTCKAPDDAGTFSIPRAAAAVAIGDASDTTSTTAVLALSVARLRTETKKDKTAFGALAETTVQPEGWLVMSTMSMESTSFTGCSGGATACEDSCADLKTDTENCGACGNACQSGESCNAGTCGSPAEACESCVNNAEATTCASVLNACKGDAACSALATCSSKCTDQTCINNCASTNPTGVTKYNAYVGCLQSACSSACGG